ncbi:hypothetical protein AGMMS50233_02050 [Endomicrobiia bacterium]|nr:hypothetical protein AGMMS50233_02050 [Endomicrobiia bacterium]
MSIFLASLVFADGNADSERAVCLRDSLKKDSFTFSTAYLEGQYTDKQLAGFYLDLTNAFDRASETASTLLLKKAFEGDIGAFLAVCSVGFSSYYITSKASTPFHEVGHGLRSESFGMDYMFSLDCNDKSPFKKDENFFKFFVRNMFNNDRACVRYRSYRIHKLDNDSYCNCEIIVSAGGMNNEIYLAERISDDIYTRNKETRLLPYILYLENRFSPIKYDRTAKELGDDPFDIRKAFKEKRRLDFKKGVIEDAGVRSLFLSGTTYSPLYSFFTKKPLKLYGFRIPDVFPYITTKGMSYKVVSGYEINEDLRLIFGFERVFKVEPATEYSLGLEQTATINHALPISYRGVVTFGQGLDLEASCSIPISKYLSIGAGLEIYSCKSLQGQRRATSGMLDKNGMFDENGLSCDVFVSMSYKF